MEGVRRPVGDLPPEVYWRRRIVVLGVLVLVIVVLFLFLGNVRSALVRVGIYTIC